jgi:hypothetical protein
MLSWPRGYSDKAVAYTFFITIGISMAFAKYIMPFGMMVVGLLIVIMFFYGLSYYSRQWILIGPQNLERNLFLYGIFFRLLFVLYLYILSYIIDPGSYPFELYAADSWVYHVAALKLSDTSFSDFFNTLPNLMKSRSDYGFPIYQSLIYKLVGPYTLPVRLINCILGSFTVIFLSRISRFLFTENHAKLTGIIAMLFPSLLWFDAMQLKETLMIFLVVSVFYHSIKINRLRIVRLHSIIIILLFSFFLFYFRTFLAVLVIMSVLAYFTLSTMKRLNFRKVFILIIVFSVSILMINNSGLFSDINQTYIEGQEGDFFSRNIESEANRLGNVSFKEAAVAPFIVSGSLLTPFPSFLYTEERQIPIIAHFQNEMIRNLMYYFAILGLVFLIRKDFRNSSILLFFCLGYLYVITTSGTSFQDRFHLPLEPFVIIAMSVGMLNSKPRWIYNWSWYLVIIFIAQISWTIFKLNIRGI